MVSCLSSFFVFFVSFVPFVIQTLHAAQPYQPVHPDPVLESWRWRSFLELKGLGLRCMAEAGDGAMWFGVNDGAVRYDGITWTTYTPEQGLLGAPVITLCATRDGSVYAGTRSGISRFSDGKWRPVFPLEGDLPWFIWDLMEASDGSLWAGTLWGALRLDREESTLYTTEEMGAALKLIAPYVRLSIVPDEAAPALPWREGIGVRAWRGIIYGLAPGGPGQAADLKVGDRILTVDKQPPDVRGSRLNGPAGTSVTLTVQREDPPEPFEITLTRQQVEGTFRQFRVYDVYEDRNGRIWFGLYDGEIVRYESLHPNRPTAWRLYSQQDGLDIGLGPHIVQTRDGAIWTVSRDLGGVNRFDRQTWTTFRLSDLRRSGLGNPNPGDYDSNRSILETADGTLWVGGITQLHAYRNGVGNATWGERLDGGSWTVYRSRDVPIPAPHITGLLEASDGALWMVSPGQEAVRLDYGTSRWATYENLRLQCETPDGAQWFLSQDNEVVHYDGRTWERYGVEDGLMDDPRRLIATRQGVLWAAGSHDTTAATARFDGRRWSLKTHPKLSRNIMPPAVYASSDGAVWFGAGWDPRDEPRTLEGVLQFDGKSWTHHTPPEAPSVSYGIGQTSDGVLWFGGTFGLRRFDGQTWTTVTDPEEFTTTVIGQVYTTRNGDLWVGTRTYGAFHYDGKAWTRYDMRDGLADNSIRSFLQMDDGSVWAWTSEGTSRFDGRTWTTHALPPDLKGWLQQSRDGALWINVWQEGGTIRYEPDANPPETEITLSLDEVSQPGNTTFAWKGADPWRSTPDGELQYAYRLGGDEWSFFSPDKSVILETLPSGKHTFEVKARDRDFNEDSTPASVSFTVVPPVWQEPWFIGMVVVFLSAIGFQTGRVVRRDRRLREANTALSSANKDLFGLNQKLDESNQAMSAANKKLFQANRSLQREGAVERIRGEVQAMEQAADFEKVLTVLAEDLKGVGLSFNTCGIDVLDEPVEEPTIDHFETHGFDYTTYTIDPEGKVLQKSPTLTAPFPEVIDETLHRFIAGEPWQGTSSGTAIVEVPIAQYGRLRLTASDRQAFTEEEIGTLQDFGSAIALGYTRYLDFVNLEAANREIREQTDRKSTFLASMSHEIRTPMTAIKGYVDNMLDGITGELNERQKRNLTRVTQNSDHLMNLINDILDLSKIEAGRMDVDVKSFDVKELIASCCDTVGPLVKSGVALKQEISRDVGEAHTDEGRLRQIVINLLSNALKFTEAGEVAVRTSKANEHLVIAVSDTGTGIPADALESIFEEFQQVKGSDPQHKGTGLGLPITKGFAELLGGSIGVQSEVGKGSTFTVKVPVVYKEG